jgi:hypothetical protein
MWHLFWHFSLIHWRAREAPSLIFLNPFEAIEEIKKMASAGMNEEDEGDRA